MIEKQTTRVTMIGIVYLLLTASTWAQGPNLVPPAPDRVANYWCTWYAQNYWIGRGTDLQDLKRVTNSNAREELNDHTVFNEKDGWATTYFDRDRSDFIFLIDHGWQTKEPSERIAGGPAFFNLIADPRDFPRYAGLEPKERLRVFNREIKALGWDSLGLWTRGDVTPEQARTFVEWSKYAGIRYWKIDGGDVHEFNSFKAKEELDPELILEYVTGAGGNINPKWDQDLTSYPSVYEVGGNQQQNMLRVLQHTDTFRTYDSSPLLMSVTTLRRTHDILKQTQQQPKYRGILNVQDDCNTAIGLGVLVASKRHPNWNERTLKGRDLHHQLSGKRHMQKRINEVERFGRWARLAPAFPAGQGVYLSSENELIDRCEFTEWDTWAANTYGKLVSQSAPAIMARNMPLPEVEIEGEPPYVCATSYPNGPTGIATEGRVKPENHWFHPRAKVTVKIKNAAQPIGIAGHYDELVLEFAGSIEGIRHVWAQDLLADQSVDIKDQVTLLSTKMIIDGELIDRVGTSAGDDGDLSAPGMLIKLDGDSLPEASDDFTPHVKPVSSLVEPTHYEGGYRGTATFARDPYGYRVKSSGTVPSVVLKPIPRSIHSGSATISWKMKAANNASTKNGFIVLSSDEDATAAVVAGAWFGANQITLFENVGKWDGPEKACKCEGELDCTAVIDLDARSLKLTVNGVEMESNFSESVTSINYIGFGVQNAETLFTEPVIK
ncbi:hypothetical protein [Novipirellula artificiosorum]|uniref:Uncharacterized protein n=1 Tax=Novipirellula artificiosorum TaxID=2528016 RepID=A0A5C6DZP6_9BACT|nr:hypothetical protein [Novipirellula artificiosorum]TWU40536.1 hypothetical protein Poly41_13690 [Novipirellula artificiosorum]